MVVKPNAFFISVYIQLALEQYFLLMWPLNLIWPHVCGEELRLLYLGLDM